LFVIIIGMRKIINYPDPVLREVCQQVTEVNETLKTEIKDLVETLRDGQIGAGLAAPQIGITKRFFGVVDELNRKEIKLFINPRVTQTFGQQKTYVKMVMDKGKDEDFLEGCLSFPDFFGTVKRFLKIGVEWDEVENDRLVTKKKIIEGFEALVFQHESDHLDGILFVDHIKAEGGLLYKMMGKDMVRWSVDKVIEKEKEKFSNF